MSFPKIDVCIMADAVRDEGRGKFSLLGFMGLMPHVEILLEYADRPAQLAFVMLGGPGEGTFPVSIDIIDGNGAAVVPMAPPFPVTLQKGKRMALLPSLQVIFRKSGTYRFRFYVNGQVHYQDSFNVLIGTLPQ